MHHVCNLCIPHICCLCLLKPYAMYKIGPHIHHTPQERKSMLGLRFLLFLLFHSFFDNTVRRMDDWKGDNWRDYLWHCDSCKCKIKKGDKYKQAWCSRFLDEEEYRKRGIFIEERHLLLCEKCEFSYATDKGYKLFYAHDDYILDENRKQYDCIPTPILKAAAEQKMGSKVESYVKREDLLDFWSFYDLSKEEYLQNHPDLMQNFKKIEK